MPHSLWHSVLTRARYVLTQHQSRALILFYHGVMEAVSDPWRLHLPPARFAEQLDIIKRHATVLRLDELVRGLNEGKLPRRAVVITFDDGYANNLTHAKPLLEKYGVPATIFIASGYLGGQREFWSDELERLLLTPGRLPAHLRLRINGHSPAWDLREAADYQPSDYARHRTWNAWQPETPTLRHTVYRALYQEMQTLPQTEQQRVLAELQAQVEFTAAPRPLHRFLTLAELHSLAQDELIEIGSHTVTHPLLPHLSPAEQEGEIHDSKIALEEITGRPVTSFAYPYGRYTAETARIVRATGFLSACAAEGTVTQAKADLFQLPRCPVQDWDGAQFERLLTWWFRQ
ncbi:MAG: polysaccharide deacetylase family protein [Acidobacteria bacterium]|nr:polysaccharide deacetylase family protein [Acidobacteriota bacterium]MBI3422424.1 polysaccharide deacetylase family protein [Acidobacteriota bacterium]